MNKFFALILGGTLFLSHSYAFTPAQDYCAGSPWYKSSLTLKSETLPTNFLSKEVDGYANLKNPTKIPLYYSSYGAKRKIQSNQVYEAKGDVWELVYGDSGEYGPQSKYLISHETLSLTQLKVVDVPESEIERIEKEIKELNRYTGAGPGRPKGLPEPPREIKFSFSVEYKSKKHLITGLYKRALNPNYDAGLKPGPGSCKN